MLMTMDDDGFECGKSSSRANHIKSAPIFKAHTQTPHTRSLTQSTSFPFEFRQQRPSRVRVYVNVKKLPVFGKAFKRFGGNEATKDSFALLLSFNRIVQFFGSNCLAFFVLFTFCSAMCRIHPVLHSDLNMNFITNSIEL